MVHIKNSDNMENKKFFSSLFFLCVLMIAILSTILAFFLSKYDKPNVNYLIKSINYVFSITDKPIILNYPVQTVLNPKELKKIYVKIKDNDLETPTYLTIIKPDGKKVTSLSNLDYNQEYEGFNLTNFNGTILVGEDELKNIGAWQIKITYLNYHGPKYLNPQIIYY